MGTVLLRRPRSYPAERIDHHADQTGVQRAVFCLLAALFFVLRDNGMLERS